MKRGERKARRRGLGGQGSGSSRDGIAASVWKRKREERRGGAGASGDGIAATDLEGEGSGSSEDDGIAALTVLLEKKEDWGRSGSGKFFSWLWMLNEAKEDAVRWYPEFKMNGVKWEYEIKYLVDMVRKLHVIMYLENEDMWSRDFVLEEIDEVLKTGRQRYIQLKIAAKEGWGVAGKLEQEFESFVSWKEEEKMINNARKRAKREKESQAKDKGGFKPGGGYGGWKGGFGNGGGTNRIVWQTRDPMWRPWYGKQNYGYGGALMGGGGQGWSGGRGYGGTPMGGGGQGWSGGAGYGGWQGSGAGVSNIICHNCRGVGHKAASCPTQRGLGGQK